MKAGDNTLNVLCALRAAHTLASGGYADTSHPDARAAVLVDYIQFLTTPGTHSDTYAESFHRSFFADWKESRATSSWEILKFAERRSKLKLCSSLPDSQLDAIGCLPMILPFILLSASSSEVEAVSAAVEFVKLSHPHPRVPEYVSIYSRALHAVLGGASVCQQAERALRALGVWETCKKYSQQASRFPESSEERLRVHQSAVSDLGLACYTKGALSSMLYLAHQFHDDPTAGILANTNCGGENCNRGAALGALLGAGGSYTNATIPQDWKDKLRDAQDYIPDILKYLQH
ncbi:coagulation factor VII isoform X4 [Dunckerocampus dactyliophorus]|nr:coagulation factor VII isoform X4 [Dunckerocampus dactyliophorus]